MSQSRLAQEMDRLLKSVPETGLEEKDAGHRGVTSPELRSPDWDSGARSLRAWPRALFHSTATPCEGFFKLFEVAAEKPGPTEPQLLAALQAPAHGAWGRDEPKMRPATASARQRERRFLVQLRMPRNPRIVPSEALDISGSGTLDPKQIRDMLSSFGART